VCPQGEECKQGQCVQHGTEPPPDFDGGFGGFGASSPNGGNGTGASGTGASPSSDDFGDRDTYGGCGCRTAGDSRAASSVALGIALAALAHARRIRRRKDEP
jgi:MYXO-CTERM domain-containing protein